MPGKNTALDYLPTALLYCVTQTLYLTMDPHWLPTPKACEIALRAPLLQVSTETAATSLHSPLLH